MKKRLFCVLIVFSILLFGCNNREEESDDVENTEDIVIEPESAVTTEAETEEIINMKGYGGANVIRIKLLPIDKAVQQIAFYKEGDQEFLFVTQREKSTAYLSRCRVDRKEKTATTLDHIALQNYGHAESMDVSYHNGKLYVFIASKANSINDSYWGTEITRFVYDKGKISDERTITGLQYATTDGSILSEGATPYRANFGMDDDADVLAIYIRADKNNSGGSIKHRISTYKLSDIHAALDRSQRIDLKDHSSSLMATTGNKSASEICANGSFQGIEVHASGMICVSGGSTSQKPQISYFTTSRKSISRTEIKDVEYIVSKKFGEVDFRKTKTYIEIESIKFYDGKYYCAFNPSGDLERNFTEIYVLAQR